MEPKTPVRKTSSKSSKHFFVIYIYTFSWILCRSSHINVFNFFDVYKFSEISNRVGSFSMVTNEKFFYIMSVEYTLLGNFTHVRFSPIISSLNFRGIEHIGVIQTDRSISSSYMKFFSISEKYYNFGVTELFV